MKEKKISGKCSTLNLSSFRYILCLMMREAKTEFKEKSGMNSPKLFAKIILIYLSN